MSSFQVLASSELSDKKLKDFGDTYTEVSKINQGYTASMEKVKGPEQARQMQAQAQSKMQKTIVDNGFTVEEYNTILNNIQTDKELQQRFLSIVQK